LTTCLYFQLDIVEHTQRGWTAWKLFWRSWELSKPPDYQCRYVLLWRNNITSGQYDTVFHNDPVRRTTSVYRVSRKKLKWSRYCICCFIIAANWGKVAVTPVWYRSTLAQLAERRRYAGAWFGNHRVGELWVGLKEYTVKRQWILQNAKWLFSAVNLSCNCILPKCIKHRGIGMTTIKSSLFIPPGQDYCAKIPRWLKWPNASW
jgi:hypothetical protein